MTVNKDQKAHNKMMGEKVPQTEMVVDKPSTLMPVLKGADAVDVGRLMIFFPDDAITDLMAYKGFDIDAQTIKESANAFVPSGEWSDELNIIFTKIKEAMEDESITKSEYSKLMQNSLRVIELGMKQRGEINNVKEITVVRQNYNDFRSIVMGAIEEVGGADLKERIIEQLKTAADEQ